MKRILFLTSLSVSITICWILSSTVDARGGSAPNSYLKLQPSSPGTPQSGNTNILGTMIMGGFQLGGSATPGQVLTANANGIGTWQSPGLALPFSGTGSAPAGQAMFGITDTGSGYALVGISGLASGVYGRSDGPNGKGVIGSAISASGTTYGGWFTSSSNVGIGIYAKGHTGGQFESTDNNGLALSAYGGTGVSATAGLFQCDSTTGTGITVNNFAATGNTYTGLFNNSSTSGIAVFGKATAPGGWGGKFEGALNGIGIYGKTPDTGGWGGQFEGGTGGIVATQTSASLYGQAVLAWSNLNGISVFGTGGGTGGYFQANGQYALGVKGELSTDPGLQTTYAGLFITSTSSTKGIGVAGVSWAPTGVNYGGWFKAVGNQGAAVYGTEESTSGVTYGGNFHTSSSGGYGVVGGADAGSGGTYGGYFYTVSPSGYGLYAASLAGSGTNNTIWAQNESTGGRGVVGYAPASAGTTYGVFGQSNSTSGRAVFGYNPANSGTPYGVLGQADGTVGWGLYATGRSGASGTKSFRIDHPLDPQNKYLLHYSSEGPEPLNVYTGNVTTDQQGVAWVKLPDYFEEINRDFRYTLTVVDDEDTDSFVQAKIARKVRDNRFKIRTSAPGVEVSWRVDGIRNDLWVRHYGAPVEEKKSEMERGTYQHPELYGVRANSASCETPMQQHPGDTRRPSISLPPSRKPAGRR